MSAKHSSSSASGLLLACLLTSFGLVVSGCALFSGSASLTNPGITITASPTTIAAGQSSMLTITAVNATQVTVTGSDGSSYTVAAAGGTQSVKPTSTTTYTATATNSKGTSSATVKVSVSALAPTVTITANPTSIPDGASSLLTVTAVNATLVTVTGSDSSSYTLQSSGGTETVNPTATTTYTATATATSGNVTATVTVTVVPAATLQSVKHVIFMLQENHTFDNYFGMLNPYRKANGWNIGDDGTDYEVDGIDDKLGSISNSDDEGTAYSLFKFTSTCIDDESSDWLASYGDVNTYNFLATRPILMNGFVHNAEGYAKSCTAPGAVCSGNFTDLTGKRSMGYYDQDFLNYYYYMASQFAVSDRWFSPVSSKSILNRIATFTGGTTQGLVKDPGNDHLPQLDIPNVFQELQQANVSWKIYYTVTQGLCLADDDCSGSASASFPASDFTTLAYSTQFLTKIRRVQRVSHQHSLQVPLVTRRTPSASIRTISLQSSNTQRTSRMALYLVSPLLKRAMGTTTSIPDRGSRSWKARRRLRI